MASQNRNPPDLVSAPTPRDLERDATRYEYLQLLRMLRLIGVAPDGAAAPRGVRTRPSLTLGIQAGEVASARRLPDGRWSITANVFGLYGPGSPLPVYYTEDLLEEAREGRHATRGLVDLLNHVLYPLLFRCWEKDRIAQRIVEARDTRLLRGLQGFGAIVAPRPPGERAPAALPPLLYLPLLQQGPRGAAGLRRLLELEFHPAAVRVRQHVRRLVPMPQAQRSVLGLRNHRLGEDARAGSHVDDAAGTLRVDLEQLDPKRLRQLMPGGSRRPRLEALLALYLRDPLRVELYLRPRAEPRTPGPCLGPRSSPRVGLSAWLGCVGACPAPVFAGAWEACAPRRSAQARGSFHA